MAIKVHSKADTQDTDPPTEGGMPVRARAWASILPQCKSRQAGRVSVGLRDVSQCSNNRFPSSEKQQGKKAYVPVTTQLV